MTVNLIVKEGFLLVAFSGRVLVLLHATVVVADGEEEGEVVAHHHQHREDVKQRLKPHSGRRQNNGENKPPETIHGFNSCCKLDSFITKNMFLLQIPTV